MHRVDFAAFSVAGAGRGLRRPTPPEYRRSTRKSPAVETVASSESEEEAGPDAPTQVLGENEVDEFSNIPDFPFTQEPHSESGRIVLYAPDDDGDEDTDATKVITEEPVVSTSKEESVAQTPEEEPVAATPEEQAVASTSKEVVVKVDKVDKGKKRASESDDDDRDDFDIFGENVTIQVRRVEGRKRRVIVVDLRRQNKE